MLSTMPMMMHSRQVINHVNHPSCHNDSTAIISMYLFIEMFYLAGFKYDVLKHGAV